MSKTNETTKLGPATLDDHATLAETELDAVTGGTPAQSVINTRAVARQPLYPPSRNRT
jgi:hypothetical protein